MLTRRHFIQSAAAFGAAASLPAGAWARLAGANDRLNIAVIGTGGMGTHHVRSLVERAAAENIAVTRVCDVYRRRLDNAARIIGGAEGAGTMEYREVLDDPAVDAVLIATPDHWHTKIAIEAMEAGKDVYVEKPLSLTIEQALACRDAVRRTGRVVQVGPQGTSDDAFWKARDAIAGGRVGPVTWSQGSYCRNSREGQFNWGIDPDAGPDQTRDAAGYVWWDRWLGHEWDLAPKIAWNADHFFRFRKYWAYNGGLATDLLYHKLAPLLLAISGPGGEYPRRVTAAGGQYIERDGRDIPDNFFMTVDYPSGHTVVLLSVVTNDVGLSDRIHGQWATIEMTGGALQVSEQSTWAEEFRRANEGALVCREVTNAEGETVIDPPHGQGRYVIEPEPRRDHMGNFIDAVREKAQPHCNIDLGCTTMVAIRMAVDSYRSGRALRWDESAERVAT